MKKKAIAIIAYHACPFKECEGMSTGGMSTYVYNLALSLAELDIQVDVFTRSHGGNRELNSPHKNLRLIHLKGGPQTTLAARQCAGYLNEFIVNIIEFISLKNIHYDALYGHYYLSGLIAVELKKYLHREAPLIMCFHSFGIMKKIHSQEIDNSERIVAEKQLIAFSDWIICGSKTEQIATKEHFCVNEKKIMICSPGVNHELFAPISNLPSRPKANHLLFAGRIDGIKGLETLIKAMEIIKKMAVCDGLKLNIIGCENITYNYQQMLKTMVGDLSLEENITFLPKCSGADLMMHYWRASATILPSKYESFGLVALESLACNTPVIVTEKCGVANLVAGICADWVIPVDDPSAIAEIVSRIFAGEFTELVLSSVLPKFTADYTWAKNAAKIKDLLQ